MGKTLTLQSVTVDPVEGHVSIKLQKQVLAGVVVLEAGTHRGCVEPGLSVDAQIAAINTHLGRDGFDPLPTKDVLDVASKVAPFSTVRDAKAKEKKDRGGK